MLKSKVQKLRWGGMIPTYLSSWNGLMEASVTLWTSRMIENLRRCLFLLKPSLTYKKKPVPLLLRPAWKPEGHRNTCECPVHLHSSMQCNELCLDTDYKNVALWLMKEVQDIKRTNMWQNFTSPFLLFSGERARKRESPKITIWDMTQAHWLLLDDGQSDIRIVNLVLDIGHKTMHLPPKTNWKLYREDFSRD